MPDGPGRSSVLFLLDSLAGPLYLGVHVNGCIGADPGDPAFPPARSPEGKGVVMCGRCVLVAGAGLMLSLVLASSPVLAQITTGTVSGTVKDASGGMIPGATVVLTSETR